MRPWWDQTPWDGILWGKNKVRERYVENYLNKWRAVLIEFYNEEFQIWEVSSYEYLWEIHSKEFDASAWSFNISNLHTISSAAQNVMFKNNRNDKNYFPVWQSYNDNSATLRKYVNDEIFETWTLDPLTETVIDWNEPANWKQESTYKVEAVLMADCPEWFIIEWWLSWAPVGKADWIHVDPTPRVAWPLNLTYDRPNETLGTDQWYSRVTDIKNKVLLPVAATVEDSNIPYLKRYYKEFIDEQISTQAWTKWLSDTAWVTWDMPTIIDNTDWTVNIWESNVYLFNNSDYIRPLGYFNISWVNWLTFIDWETNYIIANYNNWNPQYQSTTNLQLINNSDVIPIYTVFREWNTLRILWWESFADWIPNRLINRFVKTERFKREEDGWLILTEVWTRELKVTSWTVWQWASRIITPEILSWTTPLKRWEYIWWTWSYLTDSQYTNTLYNSWNWNILLPNNKYVVEWVYVSIENNAEIHTILSDKFNKISKAEKTQPPTELPDYIKTHTLLVWRIITWKNYISWIVQSTFDMIFNWTTIDSESIEDLQNKDNEFDLIINQIKYKAAIPYWGNIADIKPWWQVCDWTNWTPNLVWKIIEWASDDLDLLTEDLSIKNWTSSATTIPNTKLYWIAYVW